MARRKNEKLRHNEKVRKAGPELELKVGMTVRLQDPTTKKWSQEGRVQALRPNGRSAYILADSGRVYLRNRRFLRIPAQEEEVMVVQSLSPPVRIKGCMVGGQRFGVSSESRVQGAAGEARPAGRERAVRFQLACGHRGEDKSSATCGGIVVFPGQPVTERDCCCFATNSEHAYCNLGDKEETDGRI